MNHQMVEMTDLEGVCRPSTVTHLTAGLITIQLNMIVEKKPPAARVAKPLYRKHLESRLRMRFVPRSPGQITSAFNPGITREYFLKPVCRTFQKFGPRQGRRRPAFSMHINH